MTDEEIDKKEVKVIKKVKDMNAHEKAWIKEAFKKGESLRFYRASGTAVLTNIKPKDFEELLFVPRNKIPQIVKNPEIINYTKEEKKKRKNGIL